MRTLMLIGGLVVLVGLSGCSGDFDPDTDNGQVVLTNQTDRTVAVYYAQEVDDAAGNVTVEQKRVDLEVGERRTILVDSSLFDGELSVVYAGIVKVYDLDFDVFGLERERVEIETLHFLDEVVADG